MWLKRLFKKRADTKKNAPPPRPTNLLPSHVRKLTTPEDVQRARKDAERGRFDAKEDEN